MGEEICDTCGTMTPISGKSKSISMCDICISHINDSESISFQKAIEKEELEFKQMLEKKNNEK
jgi:hypothetical protein